MAACVLGLLGLDGGLIWVVAGVWSIRAIWGARPGLTWGIACLGAGARWGALSLSGVESAARMFGPTLVTGLPLTRGGMILSLTAAVVSEAGSDGLRAGSITERVAAIACLVTLVALYCTPGPGHSGMALSLGTWAGAGAVLVVASRYLAPHLGRLPAWIPPAAAAVGVAVALA